MKALYYRFPSGMAHIFNGNGASVCSAIRRKDVNYMKLEDIAAEQKLPKYTRNPITDEPVKVCDRCRQIHNSYLGD